MSSQPPSLTLMATCIMMLPLAFAVSFGRSATEATNFTEDVGDDKGKECLANIEDDHCERSALFQTTIATVRISTNSQTGQEIANETRKSQKFKRPMPMSLREKHMVYRAALDAGQMAQNVRDHEVHKAKESPHINIVLSVALCLGMGLCFLYGMGLSFIRRLPEEHQATLESHLDSLACFLGIVICFCSYGIAQEYIMTEGYGDERERFPSVPFLILTNRIVTLLISTVTIVMRKEKAPPFLACALAVFPGATNLTSSRCQFEALLYVSFPTQLVFKSAKLVPTMCMNTLLNKSTYSLKDYFNAAFITGGVIIFSLLVENGKHSTDVEVEGKYSLGVFLLAVFLLCDALTATSEKRIYTSQPEFSHNQMMFMLGAVGCIYSIFDVHWSCGFSSVFTFLRSHPAAWEHILALALCSTSGQWVLQYAIKYHGPVTTAIFMTIRQILSIFLSAAIYDHEIPFAAYTVAMLVFAACIHKQLWKIYNEIMSTEAASGKEVASKS
eukprot:gnl/TRDRNA2_/TRDRNA2_36912_c0_seq1.p1 gnl/TRDRNA2_/TRDRNA2_36912_c0~~gnl/TRDRNA2_/TRDRNA2_36912_c0_seq1.p1  ORF type:complete len:500 (+),score=53.86 gnl/TRDRNA2_/TRDRNA2_36912_c0_seq1:42-1541(+)